MSYRTKINGVQLFGNGEFYDKWADYIRSKGIEINDEGCYDGYIDNFMEALIVIEDIVRDINEHYKEDHNNVVNDFKNVDVENIPKFLQLTFKQKSLFDLSYWEDDTKPLFDHLINIVDNGYIFLPYQFYMACKDIVKMEFDFENYPNRAYTFKLKDNEKIHVKAD